MVRHSTAGYHKTWVPVVYWSDSQSYVHTGQYVWSKSNHKLDKAVGSIWGWEGRKPSQVC